MGIESTKNVKRKDAITHLRSKGINAYDNDCCERLSDLMYEHRETIYENYTVYSEDEEHIIDNDEWMDWSYEY